jgi:NADH-quinone oxidoreductase subunit G/NADP-reducing hydrogenase subunit HndD
MMYGAVLKEFSEEMLGRPADRVYVTSVMPCVRKRGESDRTAFEHEGIRDVDNVITTKDLGQILRMKGINPADLLPQTFDSPFQTDGAGNGIGSGAGQIFGVTGGVMEAAVRTVYEIVTGETIPRLELEEVRGLEGVKETVITMSSDKMEAPIILRLAVVNGLGNVKKLIQKMKTGEVEYDFVEVMACPGGCIGGGGQPKGEAHALDKRLQCMYELDRSLPLRKSHENPTVKTLYEKYLGEHGGEKAHELLHVEPVYGEVPAAKKPSKSD